MLSVLNEITGTVEEGSNISLIDIATVLLLIVIYGYFTYNSIRRVGWIRAIFVNGYWAYLSIALIINIIFLGHLTVNPSIENARALISLAFGTVVPLLLFYKITDLIVGHYAVNAYSGLIGGAYLVLWPFMLIPHFAYLTLMYLAYGWSKRKFGGQRKSVNSPSVN